MGSDPSILVRRAQILRQIRDFFYQRNVVEVEVPLLAQHGVTDTYNDNISCQFFDKTYYLQTSPEYHLKRLLCAGMPDCYQMAKAFRHEQSGKHHNPEFTMLEWYRLDWSYHQLQDEVIELIQALSELPLPVEKISYQALFEKHCHFNPHQITYDELAVFMAKHYPETINLALSKDGYLSYLMSYVIEPQIKNIPLCVLYDFPASQAALAQIKQGKAQRFEVYLSGIELANGFQELTDASAQAARFQQDNLQRQQEGKPQMVADPYFLAALEQGLPECSGVALGIDRLMMALLSKQTIQQVMAFDIADA